MRVYGAAVPPITPSYSGFVNGDTSASLTTQPICTTAYTPTSAAGSSPSTSCSGAAATNYSISYVNGAVTVNSITPTITSQSPTSGAVGASVSITGTNFGAMQGTSTVTFNGTVAASITTWNATSIVAVVPSGATTGNVVVTVSGVASNGVTFTVLAPPTITSLSPTSGPAGTSVTITGTNFGTATGYVTFNGTAAGVNSWTSTSISVLVPSGATTGNVVVTVSGVAINGVAFTVLAPQNISFTAPTSPVTYGVSPIALSASASSGLAITFSVVSGPATVSGSTLTITGVGTVVVAANQAGNTNYAAATQVTQSVVVNKVTPTITWVTPVAVTDGTALSAIQLNATASVPGTFIYSPAAGTVMTEGSQTLSVTFTPADTTNYNIATASVTLVVSLAPGVGIITTVVGNGVSGYFGDAGPATNAALWYPVGVAVDTSGNLYITDIGNVYVGGTDPNSIYEYNGEAFVRRVEASTGTITTVAGGGTPNNQDIYCAQQTDYMGDGCPATSADVSGLLSGDAPMGVAVDASGNLYLADGVLVRKVTHATGIITAVAGSFPSPPGFSGDYGPATQAQLSSASDVAVDASGNLYIADTGNHRIRKVNPYGTITTVVGNGTSTYTGDGVQATNTGLNANSVTVDTSGNLYIADSANYHIYKVNSSGVISTVAGNGTATYSGDGVQATGTGLSPGNVAVDASGNLYIADSGNYRVYKVTTATGVITTVAGTGIEGYTGDNGPATVAELFPQRVAVDASGNLYISGGPYSIVRAVSFGKATPVITWPEPAPINYGTSLSANQLNASSTVPGTYVYSLANGTVVTPGTVLPAGTYTLNATLIPNSLVNCNSATATVTLTVYRSTPVVAWTTPAPIPNGTALSYATQLNAVLSVPANTSATIYSPAAGTILPPGDHLLSVTMTPLDTADYNSVTAVVPITVLTGSTYDTGAVMLKVEGTTIATTTYVAGATPSTIAEGLAAYVASNPNSLVNVTAVGDAVYIEATPAAVSAYGSAGTNFPYSIQNSGYDLQHFSYPSFPGSTISGSLEGSASTDSTTTPVYSFTRSYDPLGNLTSYTDSVMGTFNFVTGSGASGYDTLNRLSAGTLTPPSGSNQAPQSFCWSYDGFGNRITQATSNQPFSNAAGATTCQLANSGTLLSNAWTNQSAANNNRLAGASAAPGGVAYDASGDVTYDGQNQYLYDGDGRICAVASTPIPGMTTMTGYVYDASGTRVAKGTIITWSCDPAVNGFQTTSDYVLGPSGEQITEMGMDTNSNGNAMAWQHTNVWAGGSLIATYDNDGLHFYFNDPLGTRRVQTDYAGVIEQTCQSLPYGDGLSCTGSAQYPTEHHFTGKERDAESGNDYFDARYYTSTMGRWMSPDWSATEEPVPYAKMDNPQSLNLYAYLNNNPLLTFDPDGHQDPCVRQGTDNCPNVGKDPAPAKSAAQMAQKQATVPVTVDQVTANNPFGHSVIGVGGDKPVGLVPDSAAAAAGAVAIQAEEQQVLGVPLPQSVPGHIQPVEADQKVKNSATINVTPKQAAAMRAFINDAAAHPQRYDAVFHNCAQFTQQVLRAGGVILPRDLTPGGVVDDLRKQQ